MLPFLIPAAVWAAKEFGPGLARAAVGVSQRIFEARSNRASEPQEDLGDEEEEEE